MDNYDDLTNNMPENGISNLNVAIHDRIATWTDGVGGLLRKIERNRYLFLFEAKDLPAMVEKKFSLLETMRQVKNPAGIPATVSIEMCIRDRPKRGPPSLQHLRLCRGYSRGQSEKHRCCHAPMS